MNFDVRPGRHPWVAALSLVLAVSCGDDGTVNPSIGGSTSGGGGTSAGGSSAGGSEGSQLRDAGPGEMADATSGGAAAPCGNGVLDPGEACDGEACCSATCDGPMGAGEVCRPSAGVCDEAEECNGTDVACPADAFLPSSTECRASVDACNPAEQCSGASADCPAEVANACGACGELGIGGATGASVAAGSTVGEDYDFTVSCASSETSSVVVFVAPSAGEFRFDTNGSTLDTVLALFSDCTSESELGCNDDAAAGGGPSEVTLSLTSGQQVFVAVSGFGALQGDWVLNVTPL